MKINGITDIFHVRKFDNKIKILLFQNEQINTKFVYFLCILNGNSCVMRNVCRKYYSLLFNYFHM